MDWNKRHELASSLLVVCLIVLLALLAITVVRWHDIKGAYFVDPATLSQTTGTITAAELICGSGKGGRTFRYSIRYKFHANGHDYESGQITFSYTATSDRSFAEGYVNKYPVGKEVTVFYEDGNPSFSVLEPEQIDRGLLNFLLGGLILTPLVFIWSVFNFFRTPFYD